jgi:hypothetical protein
MEAPIEMSEFGAACRRRIVRQHCRQPGLARDLRRDVDIPPVAERSRRRGNFAFPLPNFKRHRDADANKTLPLLVAAAHDRNLLTHE